MHHKKAPIDLTNTLNNTINARNFSFEYNEKFLLASTFGHQSRVKINYSLFFSWNRKKYACENYILGLKAVTILKY